MIGRGGRVNGGYLRQSLGCPLGGGGAARYGRVAVKLYCLDNTAVT